MNILDMFLNEKKNNEDSIEDPELKEEKTNDPDMNEDELFKEVDKEGKEAEDDATINRDNEKNNTDEENNTEEDNTEGEDNTSDDLNTEEDNTSDNSTEEDMPTDDNSDDNTGEDDSFDSNDNTEEDGDEKDKNIRLLQSYKKLYTDVNSIINKFSSSNIYCNKLESETIINAMDNLIRVRDLLYDLIINKFKSKSYDENLYNYLYIVKIVKFTNEIIKKIVELRNKE